MLMMVPCAITTSGVWSLAVEGICTSVGAIYISSPDRYPYPIVFHMLVELVLVEKTNTEMSLCACVCVPVRVQRMRSCARV
uniref:Putative secreted protein n=1 Tax=Anopheles triannulatus TaxID=58253 RepID=A0A2M4B165_9DIPT